jgi:hypothetical protein
MEDKMTKYDPWALDEYEQSIEDQIETFVPASAETNAKIDAAIEGYRARKLRESVEAKKEKVVINLVVDWDTAANFERIIERTHDTPSEAFAKVVQHEMAYA